MTELEFLERYRDYQADTLEDAEAEARSVNALADGFEVMAVNVAPLGYALMLKAAIDFVRDMGGTD